MKAQIATSIFNPDEELLRFADEFSKKYKEISEGTYASKNGTYYIKYFDGKIKRGGSTIETPSRIHAQTGEMQFSKEKLLKEGVTQN